MKRIYSLLLLLLLVSATLSAGNRVFFISRNLNRNIIAYDVQLKNGKLDTANPLHVYWYNREQNPPTTNELSLLQRKMAYGYNVVSATPDEAEIKMKALSRRTVKICHRNGKWVAIVMINGKECILTEIFAHCPSKTSCDYIELNGKSIADGSAEKERIKG